MHETAQRLGAEIKNSDPNHQKSLYRVCYQPYVVPKTIGSITLKLLAYPWYLLKPPYECKIIALSWGAEMKNSDSNHPKALYRVYYPPYVVPKTVGRIMFTLLTSPWCPSKFPYQCIKIPLFWGLKWRTQTLTIQIRFTGYITNPM